MIARQGDQVTEPDLRADLVWVWQAWHRLSDDRPWRSGGMGPSSPLPIPFRDVIQWVEFYDLTGEDVLYLDRMIRSMDAVFLKYHNDKVQSEMRK